MTTRKIYGGRGGGLIKFEEEASKSGGGGAEGLKGVGGGGGWKTRASGKIFFHMKVHKQDVINYSSQIVERSCIIVTNWYWPRRYYVTYHQL